jgi:hypothetical protein
MFYKERKKESDEIKLPRTRAQERFGVTKTMPAKVSPEDGSR